MSARCGSCGAPIHWTYTINGTRMPIDVTPSPDGNVLVSEKRSSGALTSVVLARDAEKPRGRKLYTSHFATCPEAGKHRKRKSGPADV